MKHLTLTERDLLARQLQQMKQDALTELQGGTAAIATAAADTTDPQNVHNHADDAEALRQGDLRAAEAEIDRRRLNEIERALQRVVEGRYGICVDCGGDIPGERLMVRPMAIRCAACQVAEESRLQR